MINTFLITGASQGLGRALALQLVGMGHRVYAVGRSENLLAGLSKISELIVPIVADISEEQGRQHIYTQVDKNKSLSIIHNAAMALPDLFSDDELSHQHFATNYFAPLAITRQFLALLKGQRVLHISSGAASTALPGLLSYCASKAALEQATRCLNVELNSQDIYFASLRPGMIDTGMQLKFRNAEKSKLPNVDFYLDAKKNHKLASPEQAANFIIKVLLKTSNELFSNSLWNIYDEEQLNKL